MEFRVGIENENDDRSIAWALEHPGCYSYGADAQDALVQFKRDARIYAEWVTVHGGDWLNAAEAMTFSTEGVFTVSYLRAENEVLPGQPRGMIESYFEADRKPLTGEDIRRAVLLLEWSRADLLAAVKGLSDSARASKKPGERWDINGILGHVAGGEWWYQERIGFPYPENEEDLPADPFERLKLVRDHLVQVLPQWQGLQRINHLDGEFWSPRKAPRPLARTRPHTAHPQARISGCKAALWLNDLTHGRQDPACA